MPFNAMIDESLRSMADKIGPYNQGGSYKQRKCDYIEFLTLLNIDELYRENLVYRFYGKGEDELPETENDLDPEKMLEEYKADLYDKHEAEFIDLFNILAYRQRIFGNSYPFTVERNKIKLKDDITNEQKLYLLLLCCNNLTKFEKDMQYKLADEFEHITFCAVKQFLPNYTIKKLGSGSDYTGNTIKKLKDLGKDLNIPMYNDQINGISDRANKEKGVDIIAWYKFIDNIPNTMIYLIQCACGKDTFHKAFESAGYKTYFDFNKFQKEPIRTLATPKASNIKKDYIEDLRSYAVSDSFYLDRLRIVELNNDNFSCLEDLETFKLVDKLIEENISVIVSLPKNCTI